MANTNPLTDEAIVKRILNGEKELCDELYSRYMDYLCRVICKRMRSKNTPDGVIENEKMDLLGQAMINIFSNLEKFDPGKSKFKTWASNVAINSATDWARKEIDRIYKTTNYIIDDAKESPENRDKAQLTKKKEEKQELERETAYLVINDILETLQNFANPLLKAYLTSKFILYMDNKDIAEIMDVSESCARSQVCNAIKTFKEDFLKKNKGYIGCDMSKVVDMLHEGVIFITEQQILRINDIDAQSVVKELYFERRKIDDVEKEKGLSREKIRGLIRKAIQQLVSKELKRRIEEETPEKELTDNEMIIISDYITLVLEGGKSVATRGEIDSEQIRDIKPWIDLLAAATSAFRPGMTGIKQIGEFLLEKADKKGLSMDKLSKELGLSIHELSEILNNKITRSVKKNEKIIEKVSGFLEIPRENLKIILETSFPKGVSAKTRTSGQNGKAEEKLRKKIEEIAVRQYEKK